MHLFLIILTLLAAIVLIGVILLQNPKGGSGLTSGMASLGTVQTLGVRRTGDFLTRLTAVLAGAVMVLSFIAQFTLPSRTSGSGVRESVLQKELPAAPSPTLPAMPGNAEQQEVPAPSRQ